MREVQVLQKTKIVPNGRNRGSTGALRIDRIRVAAYCRVSTDDDEQLGSFESQKLYYEQKIASNKDWVNAGIFADEAVTGTKTDKRSGFQDMIVHCNNGEIDMILTKSISRFARNTVDTLNYVRMLRDRNIAIFFEKENINTLDMNGELLLTIMSSLAQQEVESLSQNVKMGLQMKMKRGELIGFNGCYGYDYHTEDKSITVNEEEAEIVRMIYDMYLEGYGTTTIAKRLMELGIKNKKGEVSWHTHGVMGMIKNEKYKGDILLGKTFTTDPISKRRLANMGEENQYYLRDHHEPIVSREIWDKAEEIRMKRSRNKVVEITTESFENNKQFLKMRMEQEDNPVIRKLLEKDQNHLDRIQVQMATAREFLILIRLKDEKESEVFPYLSRIEKSLKEQGFSVKRADKEDIKRLLAVYYEQNVTTEKFEDFDGERWIIPED